MMLHGWKHGVLYDKLAPGQQVYGIINPTSGQEAAAERNGKMLSWLAEDFEREKGQPWRMSRRDIYELSQPTTAVI